MNTQKLKMQTKFIKIDFQNKFTRVENEFNGKFFTMLDAPFELKDKPLKSLEKINLIMNLMKTELSRTH
jgi:hypothetical protein